MTISEAYRVYLRGELGKLGDQARVDAAVARLGDEEAVSIAALLSEVRDNSVRADLAGRSSCEVEAVPVGQIRLKQAEAVLWSRWLAHDRRLIGIAGDPEVRAHEAYSGCVRGQLPASPVLLAMRDHDGGYVVFDGVHRAIQMAWSGEESLSLCVVW